MIVIGHRGAPAYRPEHTAGSYLLAVEMGADYIEPDLVFTRDGELVARHEPDITATTDVADHPEFASRRTTKTIGGHTTTGWFTDDFTLAELKTLRAIERVPDLRPQNAALDGVWEIPTFQEVVDIARAHGVGIYPETKHPTYFEQAHGFRHDEPLLGTLRSSGFDGPGAKVFIQSFEGGNLKRLRGETQLPLIRLIGAADAHDELVSARGLAEIATYADGVGPDKRLVPAEPTGLVERAHRAGLLVHPFTFRPENGFVAGGDLAAELAWFYELGVDGVFADAPDAAVAVRERLRRSDVACG